MSKSVWRWHLCCVLTRMLYTSSYVLDQGAAAWAKAALGVGSGTDAVCLEVQTSARVFAMAKAQPAKKAAKTVQKKATSVAKTARKTVRCGSTALSCNMSWLAECKGGTIGNHYHTPSCGQGIWQVLLDPNMPGQCEGSSQTGLAQLNTRPQTMCIHCRF